MPSRRFSILALTGLTGSANIRSFCERAMPGFGFDITDEASLGETNIAGVPQAKPSPELLEKILMLFENGREFDAIIIPYNLGAGPMKTTIIPLELRDRTFLTWNAMSDESMETYYREAPGFDWICEDKELGKMLKEMLVEG